MNGRERRTTIVICHDLAAMEQFDQVVLLDRGRMVAAGTHAELVQRCDDYLTLLGAWQARARSKYESPVEEALATQRLSC